MAGPGSVVHRTLVSAALNPACAASQGPILRLGIATSVEGCPNVTCSYVDWSTVPELNPLDVSVDRILQRPSTRRLRRGRHRGGAEREPRDATTDQPVITARRSDQLITRASAIHQYLRLNTIVQLTHVPMPCLMRPMSGTKSLDLFTLTIEVGQ
jgi:hypothetical protein